MKVYLTMLKTLIGGKAGMKFFAGAIGSFAFSISVLLCTIGIMDGFDHTLKKSLKSALGDMVVYSREGFFSVDDKMKNIFENFETSYSPYIKTEAFFIKDDFSKGIVLKGVDAKSFEETTSLNISLKPNEIAIGAELALLGGISKGDRIIVALASGSLKKTTRPKLIAFNVGQIVNHNLYDKDLRFAYISLGELQGLMNISDRVNLVALNKFDNDQMELTKSVQTLRESIVAELASVMVVRPFWQEFEVLLQAVEVEKFSISMIFQIVVVIAIFNILAFMVFINEKKAQELFIFQALGFGQKKMLRLWMFLAFIIWFMSCICAFVMAQIFKWGLLNLPIFQLPGDVYGLSRIELLISPTSYGVVFLVAFLWLTVISMFGVLRLCKRSILQGLRSEFS